MLTARSGKAIRVPLAAEEVALECRKVHGKHRRVPLDPALGGSRIHLQADALIIAQRKVRLRHRAVHAVIAADGHVPRLEQDMIPQRKPGLKAPIGAEIDLQHPGLGAELHIGAHLQPHPHGAHAVQQRIEMDLSVPVRVFKAAGLPVRAESGGRLAMIHDLDHARSSFPCVLCHEAVGRPAGSSQRTGSSHSPRSVRISPV